MAVDYFSNPPPGLDLTESRTAENNAIGIVLFVLSAIFVGLRILTRLKYQQADLQLDDWLMFLGLALNAGNLACCISGGFYGLGKHIYSLDSYQMRQITIITFAYVFIYAWSVCIIKFSIIALYRRIFGMTWLGWWCVFVTTGYLITNHIVLPLYTKPLNYYWNQWYPNAEGVVQVNEAKFYLGVGIINLFGDICILAVPIANVLKLQMNRTQKIAVCFMFLLGSFVCFASLYRIVTITRLGNTTDISWAKSDVFIWSSVEPSIGIISGCLPTLRPVFFRFLELVFHYTPSSLGGHHSSSHGPTGRSTKLNTIETISKKRTRKVRRGDDELGLDMQMTRLDSDEEEEEEEVERDNGTDIFKSNTTTTSSPPGSRDEEVEKGSQANVGSGLFNLTGRKSMKRKTSSQSATWRPDEDEMCLTTTFVQGKDVASGLRVDEESLDGGGSSAGRNGGYVERVSGGPAPAPGLGQGNIEVVVTREFAWESTRER